MLTVALGLLIVLGCSDTTGLEKRYPVSGMVTYKGTAVDHGTINFMPVDNTKGRAATGNIENGSYSLTTAAEGDGALPGQYNVTVNSLEVSDNAELKAMTGGGGGQFPHTKEFAKARDAAKHLIPMKYSSLTSSDLKAEVKQESNKIDFDLKD
jgi:hypothetical protein